MLRQIFQYRPHLPQFLKLREFQPVPWNAIAGVNAEILMDNAWIPCVCSHILYEPMMVMLSIESQPLADTKSFLRIFSGFHKNPAAVLSLTLSQKVNIGEQTALLYIVDDSKLNLSWLKMLYLKRIFRHSQNKGSNFLSRYDFKIYKKLAALFSSPKQVYLASINSGTHFPVDLCAIFPDHIAIGVRNSNRSILSLAIGDHYVLSEAAFEDYSAIYSLGKFESKTQESKYFSVGGLNIPDIVCNYTELELTQKIEFEHQTIYIGKKKNFVKLANGKKLLAHIHKIWIFDKDRQKYYD